MTSSCEKHLLYGWMLENKYKINFKILSNNSNFHIEMVE